MTVQEGIAKLRERFPQSRVQIQFEARAYTADHEVKFVWKSYVSNHPIFPFNWSNDCGSIDEAVNQALTPPVDTNETAIAEANALAKSK